MRIPKRYRSRDIVSIRPSKAPDQEGPRPFVGQPTKTRDADDYSCWTDRSYVGTRDNDQRGPMDALDPDKPQGM